MIAFHGVESIYIVYLYTTVLVMYVTIQRSNNTEETMATK